MKLRDIILSLVIFLAIFGLQSSRASALSCHSAANTNSCNENCIVSATDTEAPYAYIDYIYRYGTMSWDDYVTWGAVVNNVAVFTGNHGTASCGVGGSGSGTIDGGTMYFMPANSTDADVVATTMSAFQKRTTDSNPYGGTVTFEVHKIFCSAGSIVSGNTCLPVTGSIAINLTNPACYGSCTVDYSWFVPSGGGGPSLGQDVTLYADGVFFRGMTGLSGQGTTGALSTGMHTFCVHGFDGYADETGDLDCKSVTIGAGPASKTATMSVSPATIGLNATNANGSGIISNINSTNGGSFTPDCSYVSGTGSLANSNSLFVTCPGSTVGPNANQPFSVSVVGNPSTAGTANIMINGVGDAGTVVSAASQTIPVSYTPAPGPSTCTLQASATQIPVGGRVTWIGTASSANAVTFHWRGTDNGVDIGSVPGGANPNPGFSLNYTYNQDATYTRYIDVLNSSGAVICTTNPPLTLVVGSGGGGGGNPPPVQTPPSVDFKINGQRSGVYSPQNTPLAFTWSSTDATSCFASSNDNNADWKGSVGVSGTKTVQFGTTNDTFNIDCTGPGGDAWQAISVTTGAPNTINLFPVQPGGSSTSCGSAGSIAVPVMTFRFAANVPDPDQWGIGSGANSISLSTISPSPASMTLPQSFQGSTLGSIYVEADYYNDPSIPGEQVGSYNGNTYWYVDSNLVNYQVPWCTGDVTVKATLNGAPWTGNANYTLTGGSPFSGAGGSSVALPHTNTVLNSGAWTLTLNSGGPGGVNLSSIFPSNSQTLAGNVLSKPTLTYTLNFSDSFANGVCGTANKVYPIGSIDPPGYGSDTYCSSGTPDSSPTFPAPNTVSIWNCLGSNGGSNSGQCQASIAASQYLLTVTRTSGGSVTSAPAGINCGATCSANYPANSNITLTATPDSSYWKFNGWTGICGGGSTTCNIVNLSAPATANAVFVPRSLNYQEF